MVKSQWKYVDCRWSLFWEGKKDGQGAWMNIKGRGSNDIRFLDNNLFLATASPGIAGLDAVSTAIRRIKR